MVEQLRHVLIADAVVHREAEPVIAGLLYLRHAPDASDEAVVNTWVESPYWQFFCGETYLQTEAPIDPSSLTRWRQRVGEEGVEALLAASIDAARRGGVIRKASVQQVIVDTTVMPKAIAHPTYSRLPGRSARMGLFIQASSPS